MSRLRWPSLLLVSRSSRPALSYSWIRRLQSGV